MREAATSVVVDASALVDLLTATELAAPVRARLAGMALHAPAHVDAEILSALGRMERAGSLTARRVAGALGDLVEAPVARHPLGSLLAGAWNRRADTRLTDALYVELAEQLGVPLVTTHRRLARSTSAAEVIEVDPVGGVT